MRFKFNTRLKKIIRRAAITAAFAVAIAVPVRVFADWGPTRPTFDYNKFDSSKSCTDPANANGQCGSMTGPVFNSFVNTPTYGDERNFTTVSPAGTSAWTETMTVNPGDEVEVRVFVHNNANMDTNGTSFDGPGVATNTRVRFAIPEGQANGIDIGGYVTAANATPGQVYDTATLKNDNRAFALEYVPGSARIYNNGPFAGGAPISGSSNEIVSSPGSLIGHSALDGKVPGCFEFQAVVIIKVKVVAPDLNFTKQVTTPGSTNWGETVSVKRGETVSWLLTFTNDGTDTTKTVTLRDSLPAGLSIVPGTITWFDPNHPTGEVLEDTALGSGGVNVGNYGPNGGGYIRFRTKIASDYAGACEITNKAFVHAENVPEMEDIAKVVIEDCQPPQQPPVQPAAQPRPAKLPETGAGSVAAVFAATSAGGAAAHYVFRRKF